MSNKKRPVEFISERKRKPIEVLKENNFRGKDCWTETKMKGLFHQWGFEIEEGENEVASLTVAIVEDENGHIHTPIPTDVKFLDKQ